MRGQGTGADTHARKGKHLCSHTQPALRRAPFQSLDKIVLGRIAHAHNRCTHTHSFTYRGPVRVGWGRDLIHFFLVLNFRTLTVLTNQIIMTDPCDE